MTLGEATLITSFFMAILQMIQFSYDLYSAVPFLKFLEAVKYHFCTLLLIITFVTMDFFVGIEFIT